MHILILFLLFLPLAAIWVVKGMFFFAAICLVGSWIPGIREIPYRPVIRDNRWIQAVRRWMN